MSHEVGELFHFGHVGGSVTLNSLVESGRTIFIVIESGLIILTAHFFIFLMCFYDLGHSFKINAPITIFVHPNPTLKDPSKR